MHRSRILAVRSLTLTSLALGAVIGAAAGATARSDEKAAAAPAAVANDPAKAIAASLDWLRRHQDPAGFWSCANFQKRCVDTRCNGAGDAEHDIGVTSLALLAFLGDGDAPTTGPHANVIAGGFTWLLAHQDEETGVFGVPGSHQTFLYDHAIATLAVTKAAAAAKDEKLRAAAAKGVKAIEAARNPYAAWRYALPPDGQNDMSVTGWMLLALGAARRAGIGFDEAALQHAQTYIEKMTDEDSWRTGYISRGGYSSREPGMQERWPESATEAMTAVAVHCRVNLGEAPETSDAVKGGAERMRARLPRWDEDAGVIDYYYWYHGTLAMQEIGGEAWKTWSDALGKAAISSQRTEAELRGSWDPQYDPWGHRGGRVFSTALLTLALQAGPPPSEAESEKK